MHETSCPVVTLLLLDSNLQLRLHCSACHSSLLANFDKQRSDLHLLLIWLIVLHNIVTTALNSRSDTALINQLKTHVLTATCGTSG